MTAETGAPDTILVCRSPGETRYALLAGEAMVAVVHRRDIDMQPGAVYAGRVTARVPGVNAVFVDIGAALPGVLSVKQIPLEGSAVAVVVAVPPRAGKGAELKAASTAVPESAKPPALLHAAPEPVSAWWTKYGADIRSIICTPRREAVRVKALLSDTAPVEGTAEADLFAAFGVDEAIEAALRPKVPLPSGGSLIIESTAALTAIDVNSGAADPGTANIEAIAAVAVELRRRNLAGHFVVDMIPSRRRGPWPRLLAKALGDDTAVQVAGLTPLGMIELTRQRSGLSLAEMLLGADGTLSAASVAYRALRDAVRLAVSEKAAGVTVVAAPDVVTVIHGPLRAALAEARDAIKGEITLTPRPDFARTRTDLRPA